MNRNGRSIRTMVERSSLGTPKAAAARRTISAETAARVVARSKSIERTSGKKSGG
ncbi:hypothetical protein [Pseudactinotalea terrae]|uniref:hypothetical protein n=1 Tax=Pseudactinotalea terrae TaxID=1743262 RepID=UPI0012E2CB5A|nr:hypothetical protein [Pseudactinotalea terrae]